MQVNVNSQDGNLSPKKVYTQPRLIEYGSISKLTQGVGSVAGDAGNLMVCL